MSLIDELEDIVEGARGYKRIVEHIREVVTRPIIIEKCGLINPDDIDDEWLVRHFADFLQKAGEYNRKLKGLDKW